MKMKSFKEFISNEFVRNVLVLMSGTAFSQAIPVLVSPILTRLYSPDEFGFYALFVALVGIFNAISTCRYELAVMLPQSRRAAKSLIGVTFLCSLVFSVIAIFFVYFFGEKISHLLGNSEIYFWLYVLPFVCLLYGLSQSLRFWNARGKYFKIISQNSVCQSLGSNLINVLCGVFGVSAGLILGYIFGLFVSVGQYSYSERRRERVTFEARHIKWSAFKYRQFPKYDTPSALMYSMYANMAVIVFGKIFDVTVVGFYMFANRLIRTPFGFLISSFSDVFYQRLASYSTKEKIGRDLNVLTEKIVYLSFLPFFLVVYLSKYYCGFVFGESWSELYRYIYIVSAPIYVTLLLSPYKHVLRVLNKQKLSLVFHMIKFVVLLIVLYVGYVNDWSVLRFLFVYASFEMVVHLGFAFIIDWVLQNGKIVYINILRSLLSLFVLLSNYFLVF